MAKLEMTLTVHTKLARAVLWALYPLGMLGLLSEERAAAIVARFVRVTTS